MVNKQINLAINLESHEDVYYLSSDPSDYNFGIETAQYIENKANVVPKKSGFFAIAGAPDIIRIIKEFCILCSFINVKKSVSILFSAGLLTNSFSVNELSYSVDMVVL